MFKLIDGRAYCYQWDIGQKVTMDGLAPGMQVHFSHLSDNDPNALVVVAKEEDGIVCADVPNILLQTAGIMKIYGYITDGSAGYTKTYSPLHVAARAKPADYVYTETETLTYQALEDRIDKLEENGGVNVIGAQVGQTIKVSEIDKNGKPTAWEAVDFPKQMQPDWNQSDSTAADYVKNRTHYYSVNEIATFKPGNSTEKVLSVPYSDIPELVCVDINGQRFEGLSRGPLGNIGDFGSGEWTEGKGYGFYFNLDKSTKNTRYAVDTERFGERPNCTLYGMYVDQKIPYYYLPYPTVTTPGAVKAEYISDLSRYEPCKIDDAGSIYSMKYAPAQVFSDLSSINLRSKLIEIGDHGLFTESISEEISSVSELVLPVHVWRILDDGAYVTYLLESADGQIVKFRYYIGGSGNQPQVEVLHTPSSGGSLIVTLNPDDPTNATATHSPSEIYEAFQSGKTVQFCVDNMLYPLITNSPDFAMFSLSLYDGNDVGFMTIVIDENSEVIISDPVFVPQLFDDGCIKLNSIVLNSSTDGSNKQFRITVDDSGTIGATEVTS